MTVYQKIIEELEEEIEILQKDIKLVENKVTKRLILWAINSKRRKIDEFKKYL